MFKISVMLLVRAQSVPSKFPEWLFSLEAALLLGGFEDVDEGMIKGCNSFGWPLDDFVLFANFNVQEGTESRLPVSGRERCLSLGSAHPLGLLSVHSVGHTLWLIVLGAL